MVIFIVVDQTCGLSKTELAAVTYGVPLPRSQLLSMGAHDGGQDSAFWEMQKWPHSSPMPTKPSMDTWGAPPGP